jgi:hypothetical protein
MDRDFAPEINLGLESALTGLKQDKKSIGPARVHGKAGKSSADTDLLSRPVSADSRPRFISGANLP